MNILLVGGFFGSGKTTVISRLAEQIISAGQTLCIVENEIGENSIDTLLLQQSSVKITTIAGGCVCCQATGSLIQALRDLKQRFFPDWIIVELTGIAYLKDLRDKILKYQEQKCPVICVTITDAARWKKLLQAAQIIMENQVGAGDIVVINKTNLNPETDEIARDIRQIKNSCRILPLSAASDSCRMLLEAIEQEAEAYE